MDWYHCESYTSKLFSAFYFLSLKNLPEPHLTVLLNWHSRAKELSQDTIKATQGLPFPCSIYILNTATEVEYVNESLKNGWQITTGMVMGRNKLVSEALSTSRTSRITKG
jgi:hypothetical protein